MNNYTCIIVEDEPLAIERMCEYVSRIPALTLLGTYDNALEALQSITEKKPDILFLDIGMDELSGIELLEATTARPQVIITTAHHEFAVKGFELRVTDYLLKPFTFARFAQAVATAQQRVHQQPSRATQDIIFIKTGNRLEKLVLDEILFIEGLRDYRCIHTKDKKIMTLQNFNELEKVIPAYKICRVHKSFMVSVAKIETIERSRIKIGHRVIPVSEKYRESFFQLIAARQE